MAIIALITVMQSATDEMTSQFRSLGTGTLNVQVAGTALKRGLTAGDLDTIAGLDNVSGISPSISAKLSVVHKQTLQEDVSIEGRSHSYFVRQLARAAWGCPLPVIDQEQKSHVCVIDKALAAHLLPGLDPIGQELLINGIRFTVVGVLDERSEDDIISQIGGFNTSGKVMMPYTTAMRMLGISEVNNLSVYVADTDGMDAVVNVLEATLGKTFNYKEDSYNIINLESLLDVMNKMLGLMTGLLVGIAAISLLVGGIGIMNMMLVSVTERTGEIGLRKALGARPGVIQMQFLLESIILSLLGGMIGVVMGIIASMILCHYLDIAFVLSRGAVALGFGFSLVVGIVFGWAPASKASRLNPIDALRRM